MKIRMHNAISGKTSEITLDEQDWTTRDLGFFPDPFLDKLGEISKACPNADVILDMEQIYVTHGAKTDSQKGKLDKLVSELPSTVSFIESTDEAEDNRELGASMDHAKVSALDIDVDGVLSETQSPWWDFVMNTDLGETRPLLTEEMRENLNKLVEGKKIAIFGPGCFAMGGIYSSAMIGESWQKEAMVETVRPPHIRHWDEPKLRRGKGHNKLKRKGKK